MLERCFRVGVSSERAWQHLERVEAWPSWASHITRVELTPPGALTAASAGHIELKNGMRSTFVMERLEPPHRWMWQGAFLWMTIHYDHQFHAVGDGACEIVFIFDGQGFGVATLGRLFTRIYARNLDRAIPQLQAELAG